jgi:hypothetical protein
MAAEVSREQRAILRIWSGCWFPDRGPEMSMEWWPFMSAMPSLTSVADG